MNVGGDSTYDILVIDRNDDFNEYETSVSEKSHNLHKSFNRSQKVGLILDQKMRKRKDTRYKPFTLRDYTRQASEDAHFSKAGGLGPNIGGAQWQEEKMKRERMRDFSLRLGAMKKEDLIFNKNL